jgi:hypothetical protein
MNSAGGPEQAYVPSIFTRIACFDNPSKDVHWPFEAMGLGMPTIPITSGVPNVIAGCRRYGF